jgi:hypothetical protein
VTPVIRAFFMGIVSCVLCGASSLKRVGMPAAPLYLPIALQPVGDRNAGSAAIRSIRDELVCRGWLAGSWACISPDRPWLRAEPGNSAPSMSILMKLGGSITCSWSSESRVIVTTWMVPPPRPVALSPGLLPPGTKPSRPGPTWPLRILPRF